MSILKIPTAKVFEPLLRPARYKGAFGGRGSGKSHFFGELLVEICQAERGTLAVCIREAQRTLAQSSRRLIESKIASLGVGTGFKLYSDKISTPGDGLIAFRGMRDHTADSIKSLEGFKIAWIDEAQSLSAHSLALLRPTIRAKSSELWASWNPYNVPLAAGMDYWGLTAPNSSFAFAQGQAISRATYASLFAIIGTTYGGGDGSTTFNLPDKTGRVSAMREVASSRLTASFFGGNSAALGAVGGAENVSLVTGNLPPYTPSGSVNSSGSFSYNFTGVNYQYGNNALYVLNADGYPTGNGPQAKSISVGGWLAGNQQGGTSAPFRTVQPTIICNYIIRIV